MDKKSQLETIAHNIQSCTKCPLCKTALNGVPGEGNINAEIVFVGEAPGKNEDETGRPFVGRAGNLLQKLLGEIGLKREDVWIGNVIKHRPPDNRPPLPAEIFACQPYLKLQLATLSPKLIVTLGRFAMNYFYPEGKISRDRGRMFCVEGYNIYPVYHPAAGLRNGNMLNDLKEDFLRIPIILRKIDEKKLEESNDKEADISEVDGQLALL